MSRPLRRFLLALAVGALAQLTFGVVAAPAAPALSVLNNSNVLAVAGEEGKDTATGYFTLINPDPEPAGIKVRFQASSSEKVTIEEVTPETVDGEGAMRVGVTFAGLEELTGAASGQLVIFGGATPVAQSVKVEPAPQPSAPWTEVLVLGSLFAAVLLALMVVGSMESTASLGNLAPGAKWSFSSWATTLTGVGVVFGTVLAGVTLPPYPEQFTKATLVNLNLFFGILVVLAPFVFQATRKSEPGTQNEDDGRVGTNATLLASCTITLWAVLGEIGVFALLGWELIGAEALRWVGMLGIALVAFLAIRYFWITLSRMVVREWGEEKPVPEEPDEVDLDLEVAALEALAPGAEAAPTIEIEETAIATRQPAPQAPSHWSLL